MKKILVALTSAMVLFGSVSYANGIAKQDAELLFGNNAQTMQVMAIDKNEMAKTEGEWFWFSPWFYTAAFGATRYLYLNGPYIPNTVNTIRNWWNSWWR